MHDRHTLGPAARRVLPLSGMALLFSVLVSMLLPGLASAHPAITYSCSSPHCYGKIQWGSSASTMGSQYIYTGFSEFYGITTSPNVVQMTLPSSTNDPNAKLNDETWLIDDNVTNLSSLTSPYHQCIMNDNNGVYSTFSICWVETGYQATNICSDPNNPNGSDPNCGSEAWFMSYVLPWDGYNPGVSNPHCGTSGGTDPDWACVYHNVYGPQTVSTDYGHYGSLDVEADTTTSHKWNTYADGYTTYLYSSVSNDYIVPDVAEIGAELGGTQGINGPQVHFTLNEYSTTQAGSWYYHTKDGLLTNQNPPLAGWNTNKKPSQTTNGGTFTACVYTSCTLP